MVQGLEKLSRKLRSIPPAAKAAAKKAVVDGAEEVAAMQRRLVPVADGDLKDSIAVTPPGGTTPPYSQPGGSRTAGPEQALITAGNTKVRYAHMAEYGTAPHVIKSRDGVTPMGKGGIFGTVVQHPGARAQPFFWPAWRALRGRVRGRVTRSIKKAIVDAATAGGTNP